MTEKRFKLAFENFDGWAILDTTGEYSDKEDYIDWLSGQKAVDVLNHFAEENEQLKKELKRCKDWINSDKNDYELTLAFIKSKGYSLKDVLEYEKELQRND